MYRTYPENEKKNEPVFEEKITPKIVEENKVKICSEEKGDINISSNPLSSLFGGTPFETDDLLIIALIVLLISEKCEDNMIIVILIAILFIK